MNGKRMVKIPTNMLEIRLFLIYTEFMTRYIYNYLCLHWRSHQIEGHNALSRLVSHVEG